MKKNVELILAGIGLLVLRGIIILTMCNVIHELFKALYNRDIISSILYRVINDSTVITIYACWIIVGIQTIIFVINEIKNKEA